MLSVALYGHVEAMDYGKAHLLAAGLAGFGFAVMFLLYFLNGRALRSQRAGHV